MTTASEQRACLSCKVRKAKCSRCVPTCFLCKKAGKSCVYAPIQQIRFRDETSTATVRANRAWRARSKLRNRVLSISPSSGLTPSMQELAFHRFLHDYAENDIGWLLNDIHGLLDQNPCRSENVSESFASLRFALESVTLVNFSRRHGNMRTLTSADKKYHAAITKLKDDLSHMHHRSSYTTALAAILLGLYQNFRRQEHLIGSWVVHFRGAANILLGSEENSMQQHQTAHLLTKEAIHTSLRVDAVVCLPECLRAWIARQEDVDSRVTKLALRAAALCALDPGTGHRKFRRSTNGVAKVFTVIEQFDTLEMELRQELPYTIKPNPCLDCPDWTKPIYTHPGAPTQSHSYTSYGSLLTWNVFRLASLRLQSGLLDPGLELDAEEFRLATIEKAKCLVDDICSSIHYLIIQARPDRPAPSDMRDVPGSAVYALHVSLNTVDDCLVTVPSLAMRMDHARLVWIRRTANLFSREFAMMEPRCETWTLAQAVRSERTFSPTIS